MLNDRFGFENAIPQNLRESFMWLCQDLADLVTTWDFYKDLFENKQDRDLLEKYLLFSVFIIEEALMVSITMAICRLNDPEEQQKNRNLSFEVLVKECPDIQGLDDLYKNFKNACEPFSLHRNKRFGHRDRKTILGDTDETLPNIRKKEIEEVIDLATQILNLVGSYFSEYEWCFVSSSCGGAKTLLYWFKKGLESRHLIN